MRAAFARALALGCGALVVAGAAHAQSDVERSAESRVIEQNLSDLGYAVDREKNGERAVESAFARFQLLTGDPQVADPAQDIMRLQRVAIEREFPCPGWSADLDDSDYSVNVYLQFRGPTAADQAAAVHRRIMKCFRHHASQPIDDWDEGRLIILRDDPLEERIETAAQLPARYSPMVDFISDVKGPLRAAHNIWISPTGGFIADFPTAGGAGAAAPPTQSTLEAYCRSLSLNVDCIDKASIAPVGAIPGTENADGAVVLYEAKVVTDLVTLALRTPARLVDRIGFDLTQTARLTARIDGAPEDLLPKMFDDRPRGRQADPEQLVSSKDPVFSSEPWPANQRRDLAIKSAVSFWRNLLHAPGPSRDAMVKALGLIREGDAANMPKMLIVDDISSGERIPLDKFGHPAVVSQGPGAWAELSENANWIPGDRNDRFGHASFAAHLVAARKSITAKIGDSRTDVMLGIASGASVEVASEAAAKTMVDNWLKNSYAGEKFPKVIVFIFDPGGEQCILKAPPVNGKVSPTPTPKSGRLPGAQDGPGAIRPGWPAREFLTGKSNPRPMDLTQIRKGNEVPLIVVAAAQAAGDECWYFKNYNVDSIKEKREALTDANSTFSGRHPCDSVSCDYFPSFYYPVKASETRYSECVGFHCDSEKQNIIIVGALSGDGSPRADTRLSFSDTAKVLFAPGSDIVGPDAEFDDSGQIKGDAAGFGVRSGTSYAAPIVAAIAMKVRATHGDNIKENEMKSWFAATATISKNLQNLFEANMTYGAVNFERAIRSDPQQFTIWLKGVAEPKKTRAIRLREEGKSFDGLRDEADSDSRWKRSLSLINKDQGDFYLISFSDRYDPQGYKQPIRFKLGENGDYATSCPDTPPEGMNDDIFTYGCIWAGDESIPISLISHIVFPKRFWSPG